MLLRSLFKEQLPQLVMFDLDGTLIDSVPDLATAVDRMLLECGAIAAGEAKVRNWVGNGAIKLVERALRDAGIYDNTDATQALNHFLAHYHECCAQKTQLYPGVAAFLAALRQRDIAMAVVTNKPAAFVPPILQALAIDDYFDFCLGGDELAHKKPHPAPLVHCLQRFSRRSAEALMVGDSENDILAAKRACVPVVAVNYGYNGGRPVDASDPDLVVSSLDKLLD